MAAKKKAAKKKAARKRPAKKRAAKKKAAKKKPAAKPRRPHEGVPPATERELDQLRGAPDDLPPGRMGKPATIQLTAEQTPDLEVAYAHYRHTFPGATHGDMVAWLLREYRRTEGLV